MTVSVEAITRFMVNQLGYTWNDFLNSRERRRELRKRWNNSKQDVDAMKDVYTDPDYKLDMIDCFAKYSGPKVEEFATMLDPSQRYTVFDHEAGLGGCSALLAMLLPNAVIFCHMPRHTTHQARDCAQDLCTYFGVQRRVSVVDCVLSRVDVVVTLEALEHFVNPVTELTDLLTMQPDLVLDGSSYEYTSGTGHFKHNEQIRWTTHQTYFQHEYRRVFGPQHQTLLELQRAQQCMVPAELWSTRRGKEFLK